MISNQQYSKTTEVPIAVDIYKSLQKKTADNPMVRTGSAQKAVIA
jgi:hypothetical protein